METCYGLDNDILQGISLTLIFTHLLLKIISLTGKGLGFSDPSKSSNSMYSVN